MISEQAVDAETSGGGDFVGDDVFFGAAGVGSSDPDPQPANVSTTTIAPEMIMPIRPMATESSGGSTSAQAIVGARCHAPAMTEFTDAHRAMLDFERAWWKYAGAKQGGIRDRFGLTAARYYQLLNWIIDQPESLEHDPMGVRRLRRLCDLRTRQRSSGDSGSSSADVLLEGRGAGSGAAVGEGLDSREQCLPGVDRILPLRWVLEVGVHGPA